MISMTGHEVPMLFGEGSSQQVGIKAKGFGITKAIVVCDKGVKEAGIIEPILENLHNEGIETVLFDGVLANPPVYVVEEAGRIAREAQVDGIIGVGGGSSMDTAKIVNILRNNPPPILQWMYPNIPQGPRVPLITIPTSAGTGSECTIGAVVTDTETNTKKALACAHCYSTLTIVDPFLYTGMPLKQTVACAFDAYTHAIDSICGAAHEVKATILAKETIRLIHKSLPKVIKDLKNIEARHDLALAATLAGYAIESVPPHYTHAVGHTLGTKLHVAHGICCAFCLPPLLKKYTEWMPERINIVAEAMGLELRTNISDQELGRKVSDAALKLMKECGLTTFKELEYSLEELLEAAPLMPQDMTSFCFPRPVDEEFFRTMLTEAYDL